MVSIPDRIFTSPLRTQNKLPSHIIASFSTPPVSNFEKLSFLSPDRSKFPSTPDSPNVVYNSPESVGSDFSKRGRPKAAMIHTLINKGHSVESSIRCSHCNRVFPREKSLAAHMRTHTGEKPYTCDYPNCSKAFCQSGQLKTHQRLHSGEKPFVCSAKDCKTRFTHSNRHCPDHPSAGLLRDENILMMLPDVDNECSRAVKEWHKRYYSSRHERTPYKHRVTSPSPSTTKRSLFGSPDMIHERENTTPPTTSPLDLKYTPLDSQRINEIINGDSKNIAVNNNSSVDNGSGVSNKNSGTIKNDRYGVDKSENDLNNNNYSTYNNNNINNIHTTTHNYNNINNTTHNYNDITPNKTSKPHHIDNLITTRSSNNHNKNLLQTSNNNSISNCNIISNNVLQHHSFNLSNNNTLLIQQQLQQNDIFSHHYVNSNLTYNTNLNNNLVFNNISNNLTIDNNTTINNNIFPNNIILPNNDNSIILPNNDTNINLPNDNNNHIISDDTTILREEVVVEEPFKHDDTFKGAMALLQLANGYL